MSGAMSNAGTRRVMVFIDGGYLRTYLTQLFGNDDLDYMKLADYLRASAAYGNLFPELIRAYYYDAMADQNEKEKREQQKAYLQKIKAVDYFEVRLGRLKRQNEGGFKQKGVDTLIAIDMITKAYQNHYDAAILVAEDEDLLDLLNAVKNTGKRMFGAYFKKYITPELKESFDKRLTLHHNYFIGMIRNTKTQKHRLMRFHMEILYKSAEAPFILLSIKSLFSQYIIPLPAPTNDMRLNCRLSSLYEASTIVMVAPTDRALNLAILSVIHCFSAGRSLIGTDSHLSSSVQ
jgi:uncharacterized LabA/DUF88 family protein